MADSVIHQAFDQTTSPWPPGPAATPPPGHSNNDTVATVEDLIERPAVRYSIVTLHIIAIILAAVGNGFLIVYIVWHRRQTRRSVTAFLVFNLAICDFVNVTVHQPLRLMDVLLFRGTYDDQIVYCKVASFFAAYLGGVAFMTIVAISQERVLLICHPLRAKSIVTIGNTKRLLVLMWAVAFFTVVPMPIMFTNVVEVQLSHETASFCIIDLWSETTGKVYYVILFVLYYAIPVVLITFNYSRIFITLYAKSPFHGGQDGAMQRQSTTRKSLAKMMLFVACSFTVCQGPHFCTFLFIAMGFRVERDPIFTLMVIELLPMISAVLNPIVYSVRARVFHKGLTRGGSLATDTQGQSLKRRPTNPMLDTSLISRDTLTTSVRSDSIASGSNAAKDARDSLKVALLDRTSVRSDSSASGSNTAKDARDSLKVALLDRTSVRSDSSASGSNAAKDARDSLRVALLELSAKNSFIANGDKSADQTTNL